MTKNVSFNKYDYSISVRTVIELVKNKVHYVNQCSNLVGPFNEALRRTCNNNAFSELYELVALANVLQCEVQSVYPYIDYRAEMKIMNELYKPLDTIISNNRRIIIFWSSTEDEASTRKRPGNQGVWNPNHFVPLVQQRQSYRNANTEPMNQLAEVRFKMFLMARKVIRNIFFSRVREKRQ